MPDQGDPSTDQKVMYVAGEVAALVTFAQVVALTHPQLTALSFLFEQACQTSVAALENSARSDATIEGYQFVVGQVRAALERGAGAAPNR